MMIGWSKRGEINDIVFQKSDASTKVTSSEINHRITTLVPDDDMTTNQQFLNSR